MNLLENGRSSRDSLVSKSNTLCCISWCCNWIVELCVEFLDKATGQEPFFRDDYRKHIEPLLNILFMNTRMGHPHDQFWTSIRGKNATVKRILQHFYTGQNTRKFYDLLIEANKKPNAEDNTFSSLRQEYNRLRNKILNESYPDFGACEECIKHIKLDCVKKHKNTIKKSDDSMWDFLYDKHSE